MRKLLLALGIGIGVSLLSNSVYADSIQDDGIHCGPRKVQHIQVPETNVLVLLEGSGWKRLTNHTHEAAAARLSTVLTAKAQGLNVELIFKPDSGIECAKSVYTAAPIK
ncbi:hypothetical protein [Agarivorans sp. Z349TD_8]|uniref:hypothetical protein n=1 Tax=Agarivorans sp. Z349TD_8 TaxID=3421434 RepID=UPI003D7F0258